MIVTGSMDSTARLWSVEHGSELATLTVSVCVCLERGKGEREREREREGEREREVVWYCRVTRLR